MPFSSDIVNELTLLSQFNLDSMQAGIKVHVHSAPPGLVEAAARLHAKGLVTQPDGGYLSNLGFEAANHAQSLLRILK